MSGQRAGELRGDPLQRERRRDPRGDQLRGALLEADVLDHRRQLSQPAVGLRQRRAAPLDESAQILALGRERLLQIPGRVVRRRPAARQRAGEDVRDAEGLSLPVPIAAQEKMRVGAVERLDERSHGAARRHREEDVALRERSRLALKDESPAGPRPGEERHGEEGGVSLFGQLGEVGELGDESGVVDRDGFHRLNGGSGDALPDLEPHLAEHLVGKPEVAAQDQLVPLFEDVDGGDGRLAGRGDLSAQVAERRGEAGSGRRARGEAQRRVQAPRPAQDLEGNAQRGGHRDTLPRSRRPVPRPQWICGLSSTFTQPGSRRSNSL